MPALTSLALIAVLLTAGPPQVDENVARGRMLTNWSSAASLEALAESGSPELRNLIAAGGGAGALASSVDAQLGPEVEVLDEQALTVNGLTTYMRLARHERAPAALTSAAWDDEGVVLAAGITLSSLPVAETGEAAQVELELPFNAPRLGSWFTYWGGHNAVRNYHVVSPQQVFAYDLVVIRDGRTFDGPSNQNPSYFCWGEPILAAASGKVVGVVDGVQDNAPGVTNNPGQPAGNHVVIEHRPGEFSLSGHLQNGSVTVVVDQTVAAGQQIGTCGNSGNSSEPHLHFHMQTTGTFGHGLGIPAPFKSYLADGRRVTNSQPVRGQTLAPAP